MGTSETTPAEREGEIRKEIERIRRFIRLGQNQVKHDEVVLERLESELSALAPDAPWTPGVGDEVLVQARGIVREISDGFYSVLVPYAGYFKTPRGLEKPKCDMTTHTTNLLKEQEAALRPAPCEGEAVELPEWMGEPDKLNQTHIETAVPLYRHPAPASAPRGATPKLTKQEFENLWGDGEAEWMSEKWILQLKDLLEPWADPNGYNTFPDAVSFIKRTAPAPKLAAEPDAFWMKRMRRMDGLGVCIESAVGDEIGVMFSDIDGFCSALRATAKEGTE